MNYKFTWVDTTTGVDRNQWVLSLPVTVGRCPTADLTIDDGSISRKHCQFLLNPYGALIVHDLGSKNGVYVEDNRIEKGVVAPGSEVRMGVITLRVDLTEEDADALPESGDAYDLEVFDLGETHPVQIIPPADSAG